MDKITILLEEKYRNPREIVIDPSENSDFMTRMRADALKLYFDCAFLVMKKDRFTVGDYHTWAHTYEPEKGDTFKVFDTMAEAQAAACDFVQKELLAIAENEPISFPFGKTIRFQFSVLN